ncbi:MAG TPA: alkaline phosphatase family protein [Candidatus Binataceae bacterium]|nr:alkaline phosphatase family protein [Candidatus Binataceae bacterium]
MATALEQIDHIFIVMMENRSFDHMLGYLSLPPYNQPVDGIKQAWQCDFHNVFEGVTYTPQHRTDPAVPVDPPHERKDMAVQIGTPIAMDGFVKSYASGHRVQPRDYGTVMGFYTQAELPTMQFLAQNYCVCDHWFAALPTSTQPNRLVAMSGYALRDYTAAWPLLEDQDMVYDWLDRNSVSWRVYSEALPFFTLMSKVRDRIFFNDSGRQFRGFGHLKKDLVTSSAADFPRVIFIEPTYSCLHLDSGDDDHPVTPVTAGQSFLWRVYDAVTANPEAWSRSLLVITYDEHGGFFDHVRPVEFTTPQNHREPYAPFTTSGVRVPALLVSPFVEAGAPHSGQLDHTSILKMLADKFTPGKDYSADVAARTPFESLAKALTRTSPRPGLPQVPGHLGASPAAMPPTPYGAELSPNGRAFHNALGEIRTAAAGTDAIKRRLADWHLL